MQWSKCVQLVYVSAGRLENKIVLPSLNLFSTKLTLSSVSWLTDIGRKEIEIPS